MELLILLRAARPILDRKGIHVHHIVVGEIATCLEMSGASFTITKLDAELKRLWDMPCASVGYT